MDISCLLNNILLAKCSSKAKVGAEILEHEQKILVKYKLIIPNLLVLMEYQKTFAFK